MSTYEKNLKDMIEHYRVQMMNHAKHSSIKSTKVIEISTELDKLINEYQTYKDKKRESSS